MELNSGSEILGVTLIRYKFFGQLYSRLLSNEMMIGSFFVVELRLNYENVTCFFPSKQRFVDVSSEVPRSSFWRPLGDFYGVSMREKSCQNVDVERER